MAQRDVTVRLSADVANYISGVRQASRATSSLSTATDRAAQSAQGTVGANRQASTAMSGLGAAAGAASQDTEELDEKTQGMAKRDALGQLAPSMAAFGTAATAGLGAAAKAAIDWETAWAGVQKTVDGTPEQMAELEEGLRSMAKELPATHTEIAAVAEAAGQLGVATPDVEDFTRTMIDMGESTNMSADEAATTLARFANVMGTSHDEMENLGSAIVGLGNTSATTESEISAMGQRLAAAGTQAGMSEGEVLGIAAAMSSVGIEAEAGGTAMSKTMKRIGNSVDEGGDKLEGFAELAGMSASEFQAAWEEDSAAALQAVVEGLGRAEEEGQNVNGILSELGITAIRESDALLRLSSASELMGESMQRGNDEFEKASALGDEAATRYETAASQIQMAWNSIKDAAIEAGEVILPAVVQVADIVGTMADAFSDLPGPAKTATVALGGFLGLGALATGSFLMIAPQVKASAEALGALGVTGPRAKRALRGIGKAAGAAGIALAGMTAINAVQGSSEDAAESVEEFRQRLVELADTGRGLDDIEWGRNYLADGTDGINDLDSAMERLANKNFRDMVNDWAYALTGFGGQANDIEENIRSMGDGVAEAFEAGKIEQGAAGMQRLREAAENAQLPFEDFIELIPGVTEHIQSLGTAQDRTIDKAEAMKIASDPELYRELAEGAGDAAGETNEMADATDAAGEKAAGAQGSVDGLGAGVKELAEQANETASNVQDMADALNQAGLLTMDSREQISAYHQSLRDLDETMQDNAATLDLSTEAGKANNEALNEVARSGMEAATGMVQLGEDSDAVSGHMQDLYGEVKQAAQDMGATKDEADNLARGILGIDSKVDIETAMDNKAKTMAEETAQEVEEVPELTEVELVTNYNGAEITDAKDDLASINDKSVAVDVTDEGTVAQVQEGIDGVAGKDEFILVSEDGTAQKVQARINDVTGKAEYVYVREDGTTARVQGKIDGIDGKTEYVLANDDGTSQQVQKQIDSITGKTEYVYTDDDGTTHVVQERIDNVTGKTELVKVHDDGTTTVVQGQINSVEGKGVTIDAGASTADAERALNYLARNRDSTITVTEVRRIQETKSTGTGRAAVPGYATGGRAGLGAYSTGGRLPSTGLGTDQILGLNSGGRPTAWVDDKEWIINRRSSDKYDKALRMINADHPAVRGLASFASGGRPREHAYSGAAAGGPSAGDIASAVASSIPAGFTLVQQGIGDDAARESVTEFNRAVARHRRGGRS